MNNDAVKKLYMDGGNKNTKTYLEDKDDKIIENNEMVNTIFNY